MVCLESIERSNVTQTEQVGFMRLGIYMFITTIKIKEIGKMAQQVKALVAKPGNLGLVPQTHGRRE